ncbi:DUF3990 domain-containing protein [Clostridioides sp. ES-S-0171-01]|nr:DUF3990 domain-containing protein [Clostridioides sp. ES-S-0171-01]MCC0689793.1 DUF3990 domain-containing protein [Clostridioides sp. ES-S-0056-01]MCC0715106.1 DUF3990 domain-containing protein [Clostridioides sp. ES-S-0077-01]UDN56439.1 DUF3990 domain-containing protein [Clostridioides sp. ES-S-0054-01]
MKKSCNVKIFDSYNLEWLDFILECRNMSDVYMKYDVIIGGIADDKIYNIVRKAHSFRCGMDSTNSV